jgi:hypothetical protein
MRRQLTLALGSMFVGFMGIAMMARTGHLSAMPGYDAMQLIASGACLGASITVFVKSVRARRQGQEVSVATGHAPLP